MGFDRWVGSVLAKKKLPEVSLQRKQCGALPMLAVVAWLRLRLVRAVAFDFITEEYGTRQGSSEKKRKLEPSYGAGAWLRKTLPMGWSLVG